MKQLFVFTLLACGLLLFLMIEATAPAQDLPASVGNCTFSAEMHKKAGTICPGCSLANLNITATVQGPCVWQGEIVPSPPEGVTVDFDPTLFELSPDNVIHTSAGDIQVGSDIALGSYSIPIRVELRVGEESSNIDFNYNLNVDPNAAPPTATPTPVPAPPTSTPTPEPEEICLLRQGEGYFQPAQGVWQDDEHFADKPTKQLTRLGSASFEAELDMVVDRATLLFGILRPAGEKPLDRRNKIEISGRAAGTQVVPVRFEFMLEEVGKPPRMIYRSDVVGQLPLLGPCGPLREFVFTLDATKGIPPAGAPGDATAFRIQQAGPYRIVADLVRADERGDGQRTGMKVTVEGEAVVTHAPSVRMRIAVLSAVDNEDFYRLSDRSEFLGDLLKKRLPDFFPVASKESEVSINTEVYLDASKAMDSVDTGLLGWLERLGGSAQYERMELFNAVLTHKYNLALFIEGHDRLVMVLRAKDMRLIADSSVSGIAVSPKVLIVNDGIATSTLLHELVHTFPYLWSGDKMEDECGEDYHNEKKAIAFGHQITQFLVEKRTRHAGVNTLMGDVVEGIDERWITQCTYWQLLTELVKKPDPELHVVRAGLALSNTQVLGALLPTYQLLGEPDLTAGTGGDYAIQIRGQADEILGRFPFTPTFQLPTDPVTMRKIIGVGYRVPALEGTRAIELIGPGNVVLDRQSLSENAPVVSITSPAADTAIRVDADGRIPVSWSSSDLDGDPLFFSVLLSADEGQSWFSAEIETEEESVAALAPVSAGPVVVRVLASDGTRSSDAQQTFSLIGDLHLPIIQH